MTTAIAQTAEQSQAPAPAARRAVAPQAEADLLTFSVVMIALMTAVVTMAAVGAITGIPAMILASVVLGLATTGIGVRTGIDLLHRR